MLHLKTFMNWARSRALALGLVASVAALAGCGGGAETATPAPVPPTISTQPANIAVAEGQVASFSIGASGAAPLAYQWQRNGANISGANASSYTTAATTLADNTAQFRVVISNSAGSVTSAVGVLTVNPVVVPPTISAQPANATVAAGQAATFAVTAAGSAPLAYQWQRNGANIAGANAASYTTPLNDVVDSGAIFRVVVSNAAGSASSANATLTVNAVVTAPSITVQPQSANAQDGGTASFAVVASGTAPFTYQWRRNGVAIADTNSSTYSTSSLGLGDTATVFTVVVSNAAGNVTSNAAQLTVTAVAPAIVAGPAGQSIAVGQTASFSVSATGSAPLVYQWRKNGNSIAGATSANYTTPAAALADNGASFSVTVGNSAGTVTSANATLSVSAANIAPSITAAPASLTVSEGQPANFSVSAAGTNPLLYQWRRNGVDIAGATSASYGIAATVLSDSAARFSVRVTNVAGTVTSAEAVLTVNTTTSVLKNRFWAPGQLLESDDNVVISSASGIDDAGRAMVVFLKFNGTRNVLYATRGTPNAALVSPTWTAPVPIDVQAGAVVNNMTSSDNQYGLTVAPGGNAVVYWVSTGGCSADAYKTFGTCRYVFVARFLAATGTWEEPVLLGSYTARPFSAQINDRGDIAMFLPGWVRTTGTNYSVVGSVAWRANGLSSFTHKVFSAESLGAASLDMDKQGNLLLAAELNQNSTTDLAVYRGTLAGGFGAAQVLDTRGSPAGLQISAMGLNGQQAVFWRQNNGAGDVLYAAYSATPTGSFDVQETLVFGLGSTPRWALVVTDVGAPVLYNLASRYRIDRIGSDWFKLALPSDLAVNSIWSCSLARSADFLCVSAANFVGGGSWTSYDASRNAIVQQVESTNAGPGYVLGVKANGGYSSPSLSISGRAFVTLQYNYDVLPTAAQPAGDGRAVVNLWGAFLK